MSIVLPTIDLSSIGASFQVTPPSNLQASQIGWITLLNESPYTLTFQAGGMSLPIPAWDDYPIRISQQQVNGIVSVLGGFSLPISITSQLLVNPSTSQSTKLIITFFSPGELPPNTVPRSLVRQTWIPNNVNTVGNNVANILQNDGSPPGTQFLEATPSDAASSTWSFLNDGSATIKSDNAGVLTLLLQLIAGATPSINLLGGITIDQNGHIIIPNNTPLEWKDNVGVVKPVLNNDGSNRVLLTGTVSGQDIQIRDRNATVLAAFNLNAITLNEVLVIPPQAQQIIANNGTINFTGSCIHVITNGAPVTGAIMQAGTVDGQICILISDDLSHSITFAAANSNVGSGSNNILSNSRNMFLVWNATVSLWMNHGGN